MNSPQAKLKRARDAEVKEATDLKKFKADLLSKVIVKTIVKEQTNTQSVTALRFNHLPFASGTSGTSAKPEDTNLGNLFATCGGDFATVYDDEHFGDHVAVVAQFKNEKTKHSAGGELTAVAWVDARGFTGHEFGDALLAVGGGNDNAVQIFSVAEARVVRMLKGHVGSVVALAAGAAASSADADTSAVGASRLAVLDSNGTVTVWNWRTAQVVCAFKAGDAIALEMPDEGDVVITGHADGDVVVWPVAVEENAEKKRAGAGAMAGTVGNVKALARDETQPAAVTVNLAGAHTGVAVDCVRCLPGDRLATKSVDGVVCVRGARSSPASSAAATTWKVPGFVKPKKHELRSALSSFGCDPLGEFLAVGNSDGETFVYDVNTGLAIKTVKQDRDFKGLNAVRAAAVSRDCRRVHAAFGPGVVWRAEVVPGLDDEEGPGTPEEA
jgi:WD40 repeat protein